MSLPRGPSTRNDLHSRARIPYPKRGSAGQASLKKWVVAAAPSFQMGLHETAIHPRNELLVRTGLQRGTIWKHRNHPVMGLLSFDDGAAGEDKPPT